MERLNFDEFKEDWLLKHPASVPTEDVEDSPYPRWLRGATLLMFLAAALLSAVHTIPVVYAGIPGSSVISADVRTLAANASIVAFELGILLSAFLMIVKSSMGLAWVLLGTMFAGTIVANVQSIAQNSSDDPGSKIVTLIFGGGIPVIALAAGKLFVNIYTTERALKKRSKDTYREDMKTLDAKINAAFSAYEKSVQSSNGLSIGQIPQSAASILGHTKRPDASQIVQRHLMENEQDIERDARDLAAFLGVGKSTVNNVQRQFRTNGHSNGHGRIQ